MLYIKIHKAFKHTFNDIKFNRSIDNNSFMYLKDFLAFH